MITMTPLDHLDRHIKLAAALLEHRRANPIVNVAEIHHDFTPETAVSDISSSAKG